MLFQSSFLLLLLCSSVLFVLSEGQRSIRAAPQTNYAPQCDHRKEAADQVVNYPKRNRTELPKFTRRRKRFVLFPEFESWFENWNYINPATEIYFWISNFYPKKINTTYVERYIREIFRQVDERIPQQLKVEQAANPGEANFHFNFFDYSKCPTDDPTATTEGVQVLEKMLIYPAEVVRVSRYRAHGGIHLIEGNRPISTIKCNTQQTFLHSEDLIYDSSIYTGDDETNECVIDLFWALLHETLHGYGIEHTTNTKNPIPPNKKMESVMYFSNRRFLCHDDVRAIRKIYNQTVKRENNIYDDTCRRDFPMGALQKFMYLLNKYLKLIFLPFLIISFGVFVLTILYLLIRRLISQRKQSPKKDKPIVKSKGNNKPHGYLWHDDMI